MAKQQKPFGSWSSPVTEEMLAGSLRFLDVQWAGDGETLVWAERHDGHTKLMVRRPGQGPRPVNDKRNVRGGCGYGGGEFAVVGDQVVFAATDGRLYGANLDKGQPRPLTPPWGAVASPAISRDGKWVAFVHTHGGVDRVGLVDAEGAGWPTIVASGADFYMQPAFSPDGRRLTWVAWDHPAMPWDATRLEWAEVSADGAVGETEVFAGGPEEEGVGSGVAMQQPIFSPNGEQVAFLSDASGHWQVVVQEVATGARRVVSTAGQEYGGPAWIQGLRSLQWSANGRELLAIASKLGASWLERLPLEGSPRRVEGFEEYTHLDQVSLSARGHVTCLAESSQIPARVVSLIGGDERVERFSSSERLTDADLSAVRPVSWPSPAGSPVETVHGLYYPPQSARFEGQGLPPALVMIHGGPTSQRVQKFEDRNQYFASRGFAVLDVNYRGSTGYGREYMEGLYGEWGVVDVEDALGAAQFLVDEGLAREDQLVIMGGSAGGYTVLQTLATHPGVFKAGVCLYGISDLFALQMSTHKFEAHYNDSLIGPLPEAADAFRARSPLYRADVIQDKLALYHGAKDQVVPPDQAEMIAASLSRRGVPLLHHVYEEEGHGWRRSETIKHFHRSVLKFLQRHVVWA